MDCVVPSGELRSPGFPLYHWKRQPTLVVPTLNGTDEPATADCEAGCHVMTGAVAHDCVLSDTVTVTVPLCVPAGEQLLVATTQNTVETGSGAVVRSAPL